MRLIHSGHGHGTNKTWVLVAPFDKKFICHVCNKEIFDDMFYICRDFDLYFHENCERPCLKFVTGEKIHKHRIVALERE